MHDELMLIVDKWSDGTPEDRVATWELMATWALHCAKQERRNDKADQ